MKLSVLIVAHNEEARLAWCIQEARTYADEVVVVSQGSTDRTLEIALELADTVLEHPAMGGCEFSRKDGFAACTGDWVMQLDADERLADGSGAALRSLLERVGNAEVLFRLRRITSVDGKVIEDAYHGRLVRPENWDGVPNRMHSDLWPRPGVSVVCLTDILMEHHKAQAEQAEDDARYRKLDLVRTELRPEYATAAWCRVYKAQGAIQK